MNVTVMPVAGARGAARSVHAVAGAAASRSVSLDLARLLAAVGVVWIHASSSVPADRFGGVEPATLGRFAVTFFAFITTYFAAVAGGRTADRGQASVIAQVSDRLRRLYVPFLAWTGIYLALKFARDSASVDGVAAVLQWPVLWNGGSYHLCLSPSPSLPVSLRGMSADSLRPLAEPRCGGCPS